MNLAAGFSEPLSSTPASRGFTIVHLTPPGRGAIASVLAEGSGAATAIDEEFRSRNGRPMSGFPGDRPVVGRFSAAGEQVVVCRRADDRFELHCHGGTAAVKLLIETLVARGGRVASWQTWIEGRSGSRFQAAASLALAQASTVRTAAILLDQYHGALTRAIGEIEALATQDPDAARKQCDKLLALAPLGKHLTVPWRVVLAGRPNVGKSSLLNAIVGFARAIVHREPGTTRDVVTADTVLDGWPIEFCDTAGLRATSDPVEQAGVERANAATQQADLVLWVVDRSQPPDNVEGGWRGAPAAMLVVANKCDLPPAAGHDRGDIAVSSATGTGIEVLLQTIVARLVPTPPQAGTAVPFTAEQIDLVEGLRRRI